MVIRLCVLFWSGFVSRIISLKSSRLVLFVSLRLALVIFSLCVIQFSESVRFIDRYLLNRRLKFLIAALCLHFVLFKSTYC